MQEDFHYYATYCAAYIAGYSHEESLAICWSAQFVDMCSATFLQKISGPAEAATTQLQLEMMDARSDKIGRQDITRIWASFHFLPYDLYADVKRGGRSYRKKYRMICKPNGSLVADTVKLAGDNSLQAVGIAMHVLADTWAHQNFAGTPSLVINDTNYYFYELLPVKRQGSPDDPAESTAYEEREIRFRHSLTAPDDPENGIYTNTLHHDSEHSIMNLGHGRAGHLPDYSFARYKYMPAWGDYEEVIKDNPSDYYQAFCQIIYAMKYLRGVYPDFETAHYDTEAVSAWEDEIRQIIGTRRLSAAEAWKAFGEKLSGCPIDDFDLEKYTAEYTGAPIEEREETFLGRFFDAAIAQKRMVTYQIYSSGNDLAGRSLAFHLRWYQRIPGLRTSAKKHKGEQRDE